MSNDMSADKAKIQEAILAREIIDLANEHAQDANALESISSICFTLTRLFEETGYDKASAIDWETLFSFYDQKYVQTASGEKIEDETIVANIYDTANKIIASDNKTT